MKIELENVNIEQLAAMHKALTKEENKDSASGARYVRIAQVQSVDGSSDRAPGPEFYHVTLHVVAMPDHPEGGCTLTPLKLAFDALGILPDEPAKSQDEAEKEEDSRPGPGWRIAFNKGPEGYNQLSMVLKRLDEAEVVWRWDLTGDDKTIIPGPVRECDLEGYAHFIAALYGCRAKFARELADGGRVYELVAR